MTVTKRLYYDDSYMREFTAQIIERLVVDGKPALILDQTYFYATSGGQPNDTGSINGVDVKEVTTRKEDGEVIHIMQGEVSGDEAYCRIDWNRRFDLMQHHTGQHILSQAFVQQAEATTVGFHLSDDSVTIDLDRVNLPDSAINAVEMLANDIVWRNRPVTARIIQQGDAEGIRIRKIPENLYTDGLRVIDIDGFDVTACGGTHVAHTGEIGMIKILRLEKRGDKTRVEFRCGGRALRDYGDKNTLTNRLMADLSCALAEVSGAVVRLQEDFKTEQRALKAANGLLLDAEAVRLFAQTPLIEDVRLVTASFPKRDFAEVRALASRIVQEGGAVALLATYNGEKGQFVFARSADLPHDMNALLKQTLAMLMDGRGGGQPQMAQGGGSATEAQVSEALTVAAQVLHG